MTDRHDEDEMESAPRTTPPSKGEGVRIIGAEEAQAAIDAGAVGRRLPDSEPRFGDVPARPDPTIRTEASFPTPVAPSAPGPDEPTAEHPGLVAEIAAALHADRDAATTAGDPEPLELAADAIDEEAPPQSGGILIGEITPPAPEGLPHWSEPATGEVPVVISDLDDLASPDADAEASAGLRFRSGAADWAEDEGDAFKLLAADEGDGADTLSDLATPPEDDDVAFDREVAARRIRPVVPARAGGGSGGGSGRGPRGPRGPRGRTGAEVDDSSAASGHSDIAVRVVTGLGLAALALICLELGRTTTMVLATAIITVCTLELYSALHTRGFRPAAIIGLLGTLTIVPLAYYRGEFAFPFVFALLTVFTLLWFVFEVVHARPMVNVAVTLGGFMYTAGLGAFAGLLLTSDNGVGLILGVAIPVIAYDVVAYFVGSQFGKSRLAPTISPNKTIEGLIGGMAGAIIVSVLVVKLIHPWGDLGDAVLLGFTVACMAPLGDLAESMLKRDLGIKDFGTFLPGHGGLLDRFDGLLFCLPAVYFLARALGLG